MKKPRKSLNNYLTVLVDDILSGSQIVHKQLQIPDEMGDFCVHSCDSCSKKMNPRCSATHATFAAQVSIPPKAMLFTSKSITPRLQKHCFQTVRTMLLASKSNAPGLRKQCFGRYGAMLWRLQNNALVVTELCSVWNGAMLCIVWSSALDGHMRCRR